MKILTKEVLTAFIADSNQSYIAGMLSDKIEGVSFYAEFIRKPMIQKKHKVELLYSAVSDVQDGQEEENICLMLRRKMLNSSDCLDSRQVICLRI